MFNDDQPGTIAAVPRMICIGDVHGDLGRLIDILKNLRIIDHNMGWIAAPKNTIVIQLGDQVDSLSRGNTTEWETMSDVEVVRFMDQLDNIARHAGGRAISLIGNHELMNVLGDFSYVSQKSMQASGGIDKRRDAFRQGGSIAQMLSKRNVVVKIGNFTFCHGGLLPSHLDVANNNHALINHIVKKFLRAEPLSESERYIFETNILGFGGILWTRKYFELVATNQMEELAQTIGEVSRRMGTVSVVVGHNTVPNIAGFLGGALWLVDAALSRSYGNPYNEVLEILYDDDPSQNTQARIVHLNEVKN